MEIQIALCCNKGYIKQASVVISSALRNATVSKYNFWLISYDIDDNDVATLKSNLQGFGNLVGLQLCRLTKHQYESIPSTKHYGKEINFRLFIPELILELSKVLYLDSDMLVLSDLGELYDTDLTNKAYGACSEKKYHQYMFNVFYNKHYVPKHRFFNKIGINIYDDNVHYCCSGIMLINCEYWRQHNYTQQAIDFLNLYKDDPDMMCPDQDAINWVAIREKIDNREYISWKYSYDQSLVGEDCDLEDLVLQARLNVMELYQYVRQGGKPSIIHYYGRKPWQGNKNKASKMYNQYSAAIGWDTTAILKPTLGYIYSKAKSRLKRKFM
ncbi:MAG: glycosyltransferase family 8 protein [Clostridiales bacterium]|jgi:lipopolysaccharide biosynthesis glycosyltransferase|nr:glycosyltransferase family 8 protein [Clostridiales bacterium]